VPDAFGGGVFPRSGGGVSDAVAAGSKARRLSCITCHRHGGGGAHDAADAYEADAVAVGGGRRARRRQHGVEAVLEAPEVAGVRRGVLPAVGVALLVAAAELGHGRRRPLLRRRQEHDDEQAPGSEPLALHCTTTGFFFYLLGIS